ncbi:MAG: cell division protein FtsQ [Bacteroidia bacterium]|nr:cell division protein FtsQ [Bacteroidia bacterium]
MAFKIKFNWKRELTITVVIASVFFFIAFSERKQGSVAVKDVQIKIENIENNHFLDEQDVTSLMDLKEENLKGASREKVDLRMLEARIKKSGFVKDADLYSDLKGNIVVRVELRRPIARMVRNDGPDGYIAEDGAVMPTTEKFSARVVLVSGSYVSRLLREKNITSTEEGMKLMELLNKIRNDEFWAAQIAQLDIDSRCRITIYPQVGGQEIIFGKPEDIDTKLMKLRIFFKKILPQMGWNKYKQVNLEFEGQIVAE